jgi:hypothetical protein
MHNASPNNDSECQSVSRSLDDASPGSGESSKDADDTKLDITKLKAIEDSDVIVAHGDKTTSDDDRKVSPRRQPNRKSKQQCRFHRIDII